MTSNQRMYWIAIGGLAALAIAGCKAIPTAEVPPPPPAPVTQAPVAVAPAPVKPWDERAVEPGNWRYDAASRTATFVPAAGGAPLVTLSCSGNSMRIAAPVTVAGQAREALLQTSAGTDRLRFEGGAAMLPASDLRLDRIAFSRGRFALDGDARALTLPVQSEIGRAIEDCRG